MSDAVTIEIVHDDALSIDADVLVLKYAQTRYGLDDLVHRKMRESHRGLPTPGPGNSELVPRTSGIAASHILVVGVPPIWEFGYLQVRQFAAAALSYLASSGKAIEHLAVTVHGAGFGLDEIEAFESEIAGFVDALRSGEAPAWLRRISVVERNRDRAQRLRDVLSQMIPDGVVSLHAQSDHGRAVSSSDRLRTAGYASEHKEHIFVAIPFREDMDDVYHYGIQGAIHNTGRLCERIDFSAFTGDILEHIKARIRTARLVVADLTGANPNVYLEVGFAWGANVPTVLLVRDSEQLKFDVRGQRCLLYKNIRDLEGTLARELSALLAAS